MENVKMEIEKLPLMVQEKVISEKEALDFIIGEVYKNPWAFGVYPSNPEIIGELYIKICSIKSALFNNYKPNTSTFKTYLIGLIKIVIKSINREVKNAAEKETTICGIQETEYEVKLENYEKDEFEYKITHFKPYVSSKYDKAPYAQKNKIDALPASISGPVYKKDEDLKIILDSSLEKKKKLTLILALKSSYYLSAENIQKVADYCNIDKEKLENVVESLKNTMKKRITKYEKYIKNRDYSFYQHRKLLSRIVNGSDKDENTDREKKLYEFHTSKWQIKNTRALEKARYLCPTNKAIEEVVNLGAKQIGYYLLRAEKILEKEGL
ncbi:MAG: hypothetical protein K6E78_08495 [Treponema sp.]|nr:hypothetical protein [Treponema sp.]